MYKYILFDLDGTLADTDLLVVEGFLRFYRKYKPGEKVPFRLLASFSGPTLKETFERYFPSYNSDELVKDFKAFSLPLYQTSSIKRAWHSYCCNYLQNERSFFKNLK